MRAVAAAVLASVALGGLYLALGGGSYAPAQVADPCAARDVRKPSGFEAVAEQIVLSGLDGVACELGVSREEVVLALDDRESLERLAREQGRSAGELERVARAALIRAVDDAVREGALEPDVAGLLRGLIRRIPIVDILEAARLLS